MKARNQAPTHPARTSPGTGRTTLLFRVLRGMPCAALLALGVHATAQGSTPQTNLPRTQLTAGMHVIHAQVASTPQQRETGLMYRTNLPTNEGMLFVFEQAGPLCFWMKNTPTALTAAFVADDGTIVNLEDMTPLSTDSHCATKQVRYVLEMGRGWFQKRGIRPGHRLSGPVFAAPASK
ncbi:MAG: DUF192 domain-containing protein [Rhodoferax sp.]